MDRIEREHLSWGPYVMRTKLPQDVIEEFKKRAEKTIISDNNQLAGHLKDQRKFNEPDFDWFWDDIFPNYWKAYRDGHCTYHNIPNKPVNYKPRSLWVNFMKANEYNPPHIHTGHYSFVIFLDVPEELKKEQQEFQGTNLGPGTLFFNYGEVTNPQWTSNMRNVKPENGDFLIFPALTQHYVAPFKSDVTRISVSGNFDLVKLSNIDYEDMSYF